MKRTIVMVENRTNSHTDDGYSKTNFKIKKELQNKVRLMSAISGKNIQDIYSDAIEEYMNKYDEAVNKIVEMQKQMNKLKKQLA